MQINIEINCENEDWNKSLPDVELILNTTCEKVFEQIMFKKSAQNIEVSVLLTDNNTIQELNKNYRNIDKPTNVLSYPAEELVAGEFDDIQDGTMIGDLAFALEIIKDEAEEQAKSLKNHFTHLIAHGVLHLLGYDHIDDDAAEEMEAIEISILASMGINNPYL